MAPAPLPATGPILADGGVETEIVYRFGYDLPELQTIGMLEDPAGRAILHQLWAAYLAVAERHHLPMVIGTPSWRGGPDRVVAAGRPAADVERLNTRAVQFHQMLIAEVDPQVPVWIAGVIGPRRDGYDPTDAPAADEAARYHADQCAALAEAGADFLFAVPLPSAEEGIGLCRAMANTGVPYVPSFLVDRRGRLPDGAMLPEVVRRITEEVSSAPRHISVSCVHPTTAQTAAAAWDWPAGAPPFGELKANGSALPPAVLDRLHQLETDSPAVWATAMERVRAQCQLSIVGGCCGTGPDHIDALAALITRSAVPPA